MIASKVPSKESDIWALGVVAWECFSQGETPFAGVALNEVRELITSGRLLAQPSVSSARCRVLLTTDTPWL
jgi:serine/threonine protein kinase